MRAHGIDPILPPVSAPWIVEWLMEAGPVEPAGMGVGPLSWLTLRAWQDMTGVTLEPWQAQLLRRLSREYVAEDRRATEANCPAPWSNELPEDARAAVDRKVRWLFASRRG